jgi:prepilin-type N-terminal cleavage/methylation domain-containing protein
MRNQPERSARQLERSGWSPQPLARRARQLAQRARRVCASTAGLSLVEVLVASAIIAIISVMLVFAFYTMGSVSMRAADITNADEQLSSDIAFDGEGADKTPGTGKITLVDEDGLPITSESGEAIEIPLNSNTYTKDGQSLQTFDYGESQGD